MARNASEAKEQALAQYESLLERDCYTPVQRYDFRRGFEFGVAWAQGSAESADHGSSLGARMCAEEQALSLEPGQ